MTQDEFEEKYVGRIHCGDCLEVMREWPDGCVDLVAMDPPFYLPARISTSRRSWPRSLGDLGVMASYFRGVFGECVRILRKTGGFYAFSDATSYAVFLAMAYPMFDRTQCIVWDKLKGGLGRGWRHSTELILHGAFADTEYADGFRRDVIPCDVVPSVEREHASEKPVDVLLTILSAHRDGVVLDPFCGSGTTCVAAQRLGRRFIGIDISEEYCRIARERLKPEPLFAELQDERTSQ